DLARYGNGTTSFVHGEKRSQNQGNCCQDTGKIPAGKPKIIYGLFCFYKNNSSIFVETNYRPMKQFYDVAVIGAGPSGASAAFHLAKKGINTILIEKETLPRYKTC